MDSRLEEKIAFFERLKPYRYDDQEDDMDAEEQLHRQRSRAFHSVTRAASSIAPPATTAAAIQLPAHTTAASASPTAAPSQFHAPRRTVSDPVPRSSDLEIEIIAVTPRNGNPIAGTLEPPSSASSGGDAVIPETVAVNKQSTQPTKHPLLRTRNSSSQSNPSPSTKMGKRKKEAPLKLAPEAQQIFRGLSFYYLPNDDINPARRLRITKARQHGATWCRNLADATHIIVDKRLTYADIEQHLRGDPKFLQKVLVNDNYPIDCVRHQIIANPNQGQYEVTGMSTSSKQQKREHISSDDSNASLVTKPRHKKTAKRTSRPVPDTQSTGDAVSLVASPSEHAPQSTVEDDELTQCIQELKAGGNANELGDMLIDDNDGIRPSSSTDKPDDPSDSSGSADERSPKKRLTGGSGGSSDNPAWQDRFIRMKGGTRDDTDDNSNADTTKVLQQMLDLHTQAGDNFRSRAYRLAIATLRTAPKKICTAEEARALPHIGRIAEKIEEIANTNRLRQLEYALDDPRRQTSALFMKIYGVGQMQAQKWISQGFHTLEDLRTKAELNANQRVGLDHFDDLNTRIPRREVEALANHIKQRAATIDGSVELIVGGSYRRGAESSGDIDLIVTRRGTVSTLELGPFLNRLVGTLTQEGFLTAALSSHHSNDDEDRGSKWHGCCVLPESAFPGPKEDYRPTWRRIDLLLVPQSQIGAALIYFTGNDIFNRSIRLLARKKGMRLNQRGLFSNVLQDRGGTKITEGTILESRDEKKIFSILGVRWREPRERWCG
ncbi:hypothetical protein GGR52DRAFT_540468 [Hypoxylon sp. FL1284]|nr:hypothetical protein GGR52DRAFT_540468 [Hypoxylon sp. FL1284]